MALSISTQPNALETTIGYPNVTSSLPTEKIVKWKLMKLNIVMVRNACVCRVPSTGDGT